MNKYKILIVEDDETIAERIFQQINMWGYDAYLIKDFQQVMQEYSEINPDIVLMDINLPFYNGYHWTTEIRKVSKVPIIFLSSTADNMNIIMAINLGADDFIAKPFDLNVLMAKIQATLRRNYEFASNTHLIEHNGAILNLNDATIIYEQEKLELTKNEFKILTILMENKEKIVSREDIMQKLWETDEFVDDNTLTVNVTRLRKRLEYIGLKDFILTKKGIGYIVK